TQVLIYDKMGDLSLLYRYATYAYIGGGFTPKLHSIIEATVYGVPTAFGPEISRKATALELQNRGIGTVVTDVHQINRWIEGLIAHPESMKEIRQRSLEYAQLNAGATDRITKQLDL
ncbi:MAG: 3-deoxy-D-manno-octulosonic acid transferase, partial [Muribaculaceae bacterium]|nr:3-deoxy-D-manno-octulosonic acid transferase [Muribaculaceae bacterium]